MIIQCTREVADIQRRSTVNLWRWCACVSSGARPFPRSSPWIPGRVKVSHCFPRSTGVQAVYTCRNQCAGYLPQPVQATCRARCYKPESAGAVPQATAGTLSKYRVPTTCVEHCDLSHLHCITLSHFLRIVYIKPCNASCRVNGLLIMLPTQK